MSVARFCMVAAIYLGCGYGVQLASLDIVSGYLYSLEGTPLGKVITHADIPHVLNATTLLWWSVYLVGPTLLWLLYREPRKVRARIREP